MRLLVRIWSDATIHRYPGYLGYHPGYHERFALARDDTGSTSGFGHQIWPRRLGWGKSYRKRAQCSLLWQSRGEGQFTGGHCWPLPIRYRGFGPPIGNPNVTADVLAAVDPADAAGPATTDGCSPFTNAAAVAGKIALIERGHMRLCIEGEERHECGSQSA